MNDETAASSAAHKKDATLLAGAHGPDEKTPLASRPWVTYAVLAGILLVAFAIRAYRLGAPDGGYHAFNEGFYLKMAAQDALRGPFEWLTAPLDLNNPPLYPLLLSLIFRVVAPSLAIARGLSVVAGVLTVLYTYLLGKLLYRERVGLVAAAVLAVMPGVVLVNHNNQVDSLMVLLCMAAAYHYCRSLRDDSDRQALLGGALLGLALSTKLPAVLTLGVLAIWTTWVTPGLGWLKRRRTWLFAGGFAVLGLPWYLAQVFRDSAGYVGAQSGLASSALQMPTLVSLRTGFVNEILWMVMPVTLVVAVVAVGYLIYKRSPGDRLVLVGLAAYTAFYLVFRFHSYYLLPLTPFIALAVGRLAYSLGRRAPRITWTAVGALLLTMLIATAMMMGGNKYGNWSPQSVPAAIGGVDSNTVIYSTQEILGSYQPMVEYAVAPARVVWLPEGYSSEEITVPPGGRAYILTTTIYMNDAEQDLAPMLSFTEQIWSFNFCGFSFTQMPGNRHFFAALDMDVAWKGTPVFGFTENTYTTGINLYDVATLREQTGK